MSTTIQELITDLKNKDDKVRGPAWQDAGKFGAVAVKPLVETMTDPDYEVARAAKRALWRVVRQAGRPPAKAEAEAVVAQFLPLLASGAAPVRRELLWMLSEIAGDEAVSPMAALLLDPEAREDARCALLRIPSGKVTAALKTAMSTAPEEFKPNLAEALRTRGEQIEGYPSQKRVPSKPTGVKMMGAN